MASLPVINHFITGITSLDDHLSILESLFTSILATDVKNAEELDFDAPYEIDLFSKKNYKAGMSVGTTSNSSEGVASIISLLLLVFDTTYSHRRASFIVIWVLHALGYSTLPKSPPIPWTTPLGIRSRLSLIFYSYLIQIIPLISWFCHCCCGTILLCCNMLFAKHCTAGSCIQYLNLISKSDWHSRKKKYDLHIIHLTEMAWPLSPNSWHVSQISIWPACPGRMQDNAARSFSWWPKRVTLL